MRFDLQSGDLLLGLASLGHLGEADFLLENLYRSISLFFMRFLVSLFFMFYVVFLGSMPVADATILGDSAKSHGLLSTFANHTDPSPISEVPFSAETPEESSESSESVDDFDVINYSFYFLTLPSIHRSRVSTLQFVYVGVLERPPMKS